MDIPPTLSLPALGRFGHTDDLTREIPSWLGSKLTNVVPYNVNFATRRAAVILLVGFRCLIVTNDAQTEVRRLKANYAPAIVKFYLSNYRDSDEVLLVSSWRLDRMEGHFLSSGRGGPWDIVIRVREFVGEGFWGKLLDCFYCLSVWIAAPMAYLLGQSWTERALLWPSLSAAAILLERVTNKAPRVQPALFAEDPGEEQDNGMLRTEKAADEEPGDSHSAGK